MSQAEQFPSLRDHVPAQEYAELKHDFIIGCIDIMSRGEHLPHELIRGIARELGLLEPPIDPGLDDHDGFDNPTPEDYQPDVSWLEAKRELTNSDTNDGDRPTESSSGEIIFFDASADANRRLKNFLIRKTVSECVASKNIPIDSLRALLTHDEVLEQVIYPNVRSEFEIRGHSLGFPELIDALGDDEDEEGSAGTEPGINDPDDSPGDGGGGSRIPAVRVRPPDGALGAEAEIEEEPLEDMVVGRPYPVPNTEGPFREMPVVPVGSI